MSLRLLSDEFFQMASKFIAGLPSLRGKKSPQSEETWRASRAKPPEGASVPIHAIRGRRESFAGIVQRQTVSDARGTRAGMALSNRIAAHVDLEAVMKDLKKGTKVEFDSAEFACWWSVIENPELKATCFKYGRASCLRPPHLTSPRSSSADRPPTSFPCTYYPTACNLEPSY